MLNMLKSKVIVRVHQAHFVGDNTIGYYFVNVTNMHKNKNIVINHVLFLTGKDTNYYIQNIERPLPVKLVPGEAWETWVKISKIGPDAYTFARVILDGGKMLKSKKRINIPAIGVPPGGDYTSRITKEEREWLENNKPTI